MRKLMILLAFVVAMTACTSRKANVAEDAGQEVAFTVAQHYFFNNGQEIPASPKITSEAEFKRLFGMAAVMGKNGNPTTIDFGKNFVVALVEPITDVETELTPVKVMEKDDTLFYTCEVKRGEKLSFSMQPLSIIVLDKKYSGKEVVVIKNEK